jgi:hypothetical protein
LVISSIVFDITEVGRRNLFTQEPIYRFPTGVIYVIYIRKESQGHCRGQVGNQGERRGSRGNAGDRWGVRGIAGGM